MSRPVVWDEAAVIAALRGWTQEHGRPPRRRDWVNAGQRHPSGGVVYPLFGSWPAALRAAGLELPPSGRPRRQGGWTPTAIVDAIIDWSQQFGQPPTVLDWNPALARRRGDTVRADRFDAQRPRWPTTATVTRHHGSWNAALAAAGQSTTVQGLKRQAPRAVIADEGQHTDAWTRDEVLDAINAYAARHGRPPAYDDWQTGDPAGKRPSTRTVLRLHGSWTKAVRAAHGRLAASLRPDDLPRVAQRVAPARRTPKWPAPRILEALREWAAEHDGYAPRVSDWGWGRAQHPDHAAERERWPSSDDIRGRFESWDAACAAAGVTPRPHRGRGPFADGQRAPQEQWTEQAIIDALGVWADEHDGLAPLMIDWHGRPHPDYLAAPERWPSGQTVLRVLRVASWTEVCAVAGVTPRPSRPRATRWTEQEIIDALRAWASTHDR